MTSTRIRRLIKAPRGCVYEALIDPAAVASWMVPTGMTSHVHEFDPREGGAFRVSLTYDEADRAGKTREETDTYHGRFVKLVPDELVVEIDEFETADSDARRDDDHVHPHRRRGGTELLGIHEGLPTGFPRPITRPAGTRRSRGLRRTSRRLGERRVTAIAARWRANGDTRAMVDWGKGRYEATAAGARAGCRGRRPRRGTGRGRSCARCRLRDGERGIARRRPWRGRRRRRLPPSGLSPSPGSEPSRWACVPQFLVGDALALPVADASCDIALSVFGVVFAADPAAGDRRARPGAALRRPGVCHRVGPVWADRRDGHPSLVEQSARQPVRRRPSASRGRMATRSRSIAEPCGLAVSTTHHELEIRAPSPEAYVDAGREHPMAIAVWPILERAGSSRHAARGDDRASSLRGNEGGPGLLIHSPYVIHELRPRA